MKKMILAAGMLLMVGLTSAFAEKPFDVNQPAVKAFNKAFTDASNVSWEQHTGYVKAIFTINAQVLTAYYNNEGVLQSVVRNILSDRLPLNLLSDLKSDYSGYWITELFEVSAEGQTSYFVAVENADKKVVLKSDSGYKWSVYGKMKKNTAQ